MAEQAGVAVEVRKQLSMRFRQLYRCQYEDGQVTVLGSAQHYDYAACTAHGYHVVATNVEHPTVNVVIACGGREKHHYAARFDAGEVIVLLHPEAAIGRSLADAEADMLLNWTGVRAETDEYGTIVAVRRARATDDQAPA